jgi:IS5 family transposase
MLHRPPSFFDVETQLEKIYQLNDFLPKLKTLIEWEMFRPNLLKIREKERLSNAGRKPFDVVLMFKILILKKIYNLSDEKTEEKVRDSISWRDFLDLTFSDIIPDAKTIWDFSNQLKDLGLERDLFDRFNEELDAQGFLAKSGTIVDGSFIEVPKQRNTKEENKQIKNGEIPDSISSNPHVLAQKDCDARWTKKGNETYFGYKNHVLADAEDKFIRDYAVTDASVHDSVPYLSVLPVEAAYVGQAAYADSAYVGEEIEQELKRRKYDPQICEKGFRNKPLSEAQKESNRLKSKVRCRVEHVFGAMKVRCRDEVLRSIGLERAAFWIGIRNLVYNLSRFVSLKCPRPAKVR